MMYSFYELFWLFFVYSFLGWIIETVYGSIKKKKFVNRGFFTGPVCFVYGTAAVLMTVFLWKLKSSVVALFVGCAVMATIIEWVTGKLLERMNRHKWWDYSNKKWNFDGYICVQYSLIWGALGVLAIKYGNHFLVYGFHLLPSVLEQIVLWVLLIIALIDMSASLAAMLHIKKGMPEIVFKWNAQLDRWTYRFGKWLVDHVERRMTKAYPVILEKTQTEPKVREGKFAEGCGFYKLFWLFMIGAFLGDLVETVFCRFSLGYWMSRSSVVWGPFSIVWGLAIAIATALMYKDKDKPDRHIFLVGTLLGGVYEYACSVFTEIVFGKIFWDYSGIPFNLGGRINLLFCLFWGIAAVVWIKILYPRLSGLIEKIPRMVGIICTWVMVVFMTVNIIVSMAALIRYDTRGKGEPADSYWEEVMDTYYGDEVMERIYPKAKDKPDH